MLYARQLSSGESECDGSSCNCGDASAQPQTKGHSGPFNFGWRSLGRGEEGAQQQSISKEQLKNIKFFNVIYGFICRRPSDSTVPTDAGIEPRAVAVRRSNH